MKSETTADLLKALEGVTVALVTPLDAEGRLDVLALERLVERVIRFGGCGIFPLGWCGEQPMLHSATEASSVRTCKLL